METGTVDYSMAYNLSKFDEWALTGAWAAIGTNTVLVLGWGDNLENFDLTFFPHF